MGKQKKVKRIISFSAAAIVMLSSMKIAPAKMYVSAADMNVSQLTQVANIAPDLGDTILNNAKQSSGAGFHVQNQKIVDANGNEFVMRGINVAHTWYPGYTEQTIKAVAAKGCNTVRVVCADGGQWSKTSASDLEKIIGWCKANKLVCVVEAHDATGSDNISDVTAAAMYWTEMKDILNANRDYVILTLQMSGSAHGTAPHGRRATSRR